MQIKLAFFMEKLYDLSEMRTCTWFLKLRWGVSFKDLISFLKKNNPNFFLNANS